jgi:hypothetical protein
MEKQDIERLLFRFNSGEASDHEKQEIERLLASGAIEPGDIESLQVLSSQIQRVETPAPSSALDQAFYGILAHEKAKRKSFSWTAFFSWPDLGPRLAMASVALILGIAGGYLLRPSVSSGRDPQIEVLSQQVSDLQEMMMLSLLEKGSATDRLKAVNLTQEMDEASFKVTNALIQTLNQDENVNVRLAALDALRPYATDSSVREALIRSISKQDSPLVQISLAELMAALQEKSAVKELEKIVESDKTPVEVKRKIRESMEVLI